MHLRPTPLALLVSAALATTSLPTGAVAVSDLADLSLEELSNIVVTSVSRKAEPLAGAAASVYVVTAEDIRRSGARTLPEALRLAPNLHVAQTSGFGYAISARGMNGSNNSAPNKLLVLVDGRSVYTPLFSGVFWDAQDMMLEDIERIEVVSGPGGTLWGVNAVNGVINVITRNAADSQGGLLAATAGDDLSDIAYRHGGTLANGGHFRAWAKYLDHDPTATAAGTRIDDSRYNAIAGFRADWATSEDTIRLTGRIYDGASGQPEPGLVSSSLFDLDLGGLDIAGAHVSAYWERQFDTGARLWLQAYLDHTERSVPPNFSQELDILDLQLQHALAPIGIHSLAWGANLRRSDDEVVNSPYIAFLPAKLQQTWSSLYLQDEIALREDLRLILGARAEENDYTGTELLPNARIAWQVAPHHLLWSAVSRAVRAPSRLDVDAFIPGEPPYLLAGGHPVRSEEATVFEIGYRGQPTDRFSFSATAFHNEYDHLRTQEIDESGTFLLFDSLMEGRATGIEAWGVFQASPSWRISGGYTALDEELRLKPGSNDAAGPLASGNNPSHTWQLRSSWNIGSGGNLDLGVRHVADLPRNAVPDYTAVDLRFGWRLRDGLELALTGRNLTGSHAEFGPIATRSELDRSVYLTLVWRH